MVLQRIYDWLNDTKKTVTIKSVFSVQEGYQESPSERSFLGTTFFAPMNDQ